MREVHKGGKMETRVQECGRDSASQPESEPGVGTITEFSLHTGCEQRRLIERTHQGVYQCSLEE